MQFLTTAAILVEANRPLELVELSLDLPQANEVTVRLAASGVCHTDLSVATSSRPLPLPLILGHEGAGVVTEIGAGVTHLAPGDHVVLSAIPQCGDCFYCRRGQRSMCQLRTSTKFGHQLDGTTRFRLAGRPVYQYSSVGTFAEKTVVPAVSAVKIPTSIPLELAALIGCAVVTGYGAAIRVASIGSDDIVAVVGVGGVGLNVVQGARLAGAAEIIAVDRVEWKLDLARRFGATQVVQADGDPTAEVRELTAGRGADVVFEAVGSNETILSAIGLARRGGHVVVIGATERSSRLELAFGDLVLMRALTITGCIYGNADVHHDFPALAALYEDGSLLLDELVTKRTDLHGLNDALDDLHHGRVARSLVVLNEA